MSTYTKFPDAIVFPDGTIRLVTCVAKSLAYANTNVAKLFSVSTANAIPDYIDFDDSIPEMLEDDGLIVWREHVPVGYYRSKRRSWPKSTTSGDGNVIGFLERIPESYSEIIRCRAWIRFRRWLRATERKRERQEELPEQVSGVRHHPSPVDP